MEFDISRVYTMLTADEVKEGSEGYFADNFKELYENYTYLDGTPCGIKE